MDLSAVRLDGAEQHDGGPGGDAAVLRIKGYESRTGAESRFQSARLRADPYVGAAATVVEAARNVACAGARPIGITNCLNYGNPERPEIMWQFVRGVEGIRDAALALETPVVSGNVSFYNETEGRAIPPTPAIAMVGVLGRRASCRGQFFNRPGDAIVLLRTAPARLAASEYAALFAVAADARRDDLKRERALVEGLVAPPIEG